MNIAHYLIGVKNLPPKIKLKRKPVTVQDTLPHMKVGDVIVWSPATPERFETDRKEFHRQASHLGWVVKTKTFQGDKIKVRVLSKKRNENDW